MEDRLSIPSVTGADLEFDVAGTGGRSYAFIIDWHIRLVVAMAWYLVVMLAYEGSRAWFDFVEGDLTVFFYAGALPAMVIYFLYHLVLEIVMDGRTPGKRIAGIRIVTRDGRSPDLFAHFIRNVFRLVDSLPFAYLVGIMTTIFTANHVRFGDLAAGTLLIYDRADETSALRAVEATYGSSIGLEEADLVRELVDRWESLDPDKRLAMGRTLLERLEPGKPTATSDGGVLAQLASYLREA